MSQLELVIFDCDGVLVAEGCVVVEDSPIGVQAGVAAGMTVFGYAGLMNSSRLAAAGALVFNDMRELPGLLAG